MDLSPSSKLLVAIKRMTFKENPDVLAVLLAKFIETRIEEEWRVRRSLETREEYKPGDNSLLGLLKGPIKVPYWLFFFITMGFIVFGMITLNTFIIKESKKNKAATELRK